MNNTETPTTTIPTTTTPISKEEVVEHVNVEVVCPGYSPLGTAPETLLNLLEGGFNVIF